MGLECCKWSSLNGPGTKTTLSHPFLGLGDYPFPIITLKFKFYYRERAGTFCRVDSAGFYNQP